MTITVDKEIVDNSLILVYYNPANEASSTWYPIPGIGSNGNYQTRYFLYQTSSSPSIYTMAIKVMKPDGSAVYESPLTFKKIKVIFAEASSIVTGKMNKQVDMQDYNGLFLVFFKPANDAIFT